MSTLTVNGQTFETRGLTYGYLTGGACKIVDMRGDFDAYRADDTVLLHSQQLGDGWVRYWTMSSDPEMQATIAELAAVLAPR